MCMPGGEVHRPSSTKCFNAEEKGCIYCCRFKQNYIIFTVGYSRQYPFNLIFVRLGCAKSIQVHGFNFTFGGIYSSEIVVYAEARFLQEKKR